jgi:hypothetical protein
MKICFIFIYFVIAPFLALKFLGPLCKGAVEQIFLPVLHKAALMFSKINKLNYYETLEPFDRPWLWLLNPKKVRLEWAER